MLVDDGRGLFQPLRRDAGRHERRRTQGPLVSKIAEIWRMIFFRLQSADPLQNVRFGDPEIFPDRRERLGNERTSAWMRLRSFLSVSSILLMVKGSIECAFGTCKAKLEIG